MTAGTVALYRKHRSSNFDAVIGQPHIISTLKNAISSGRLSHAYLFTGPRGVGKTSVARLLARAANCSAEDPTQRPCGSCSSCSLEIGGHLDLIEIDAASNRGIDDARALRDKISSAPSIGKYKVYIIDEVHMLTTEAFNALLKTLEEPPSHAIFILATTEAHKLPDTIISRTQRFSFRPIDKSAMIQQLKQIASTEGIDIAEDALGLIAEASRGGFRDAISLLDQARASGNQRLSLNDIRQLLGQSDPELVSAIDSAVRGHKPVEALAAMDSAIATGVQATQLTNQLIDHYRLCLRSTKEVSELNQLARFVDRLLPVLKSPWPELSLESALVKLAAGDAADREHPAQAVPTPKSAPRVTEAAPKPLAEHPTKDLWMKTLTQIKQKNNSLYALLRSSTSAQFESDQLILGCRFSFHRDRLRETKNQQVIEQALARVYGRKIKVVAELEAKPAAATSNSNELVASAIEILGGEVIE